MNDLINRRAAIEAINAVFPVDSMKSEYAQGIVCGAALAKTYVEQLPSAQPEQRWIPCSERLPEEYAQYLVCLESGDCYVYWLEDSDWARGMAEKEGILAWMPLPEPYKEGEA